MALKSPQAPELGSAEASAVKQLRAAFESQLLTDAGASIETWLTKVPPPEQPVLFVELLGAELSFHQRSGRAVRAEDYIARFPNLKQEIESVFNSLLVKPQYGSDDQSMDSTVDVVPGIRPQVTELPNWLPGDYVGRYRLDKSLGHGAFGDVWKGFDPELRRPVAIKLPRKEVLRRLDLSQQFRDEARRAALLKDDGIVPVYDIGHVGNGTFIVSEFVDGPTLAERIKKSERLPREEAVRIVIQLARSLHHAHRAGLVHRDVKPSNILMRPDGTPAITDFGLAISEVEQLTSQGGLVGTAAYMSPEQAREEGHLVDGRSDLYSLGVIFFQLLTGRLPFQFKTADDLLEQVKHREVRPLRSIDDTIPVELEAICLKCLAKNVSDRYSTGRDLAEDLQTWSRLPSVVARRRRFVTVVTAVLLAVTVGLTLYLKFADVGSKSEASHVTSLGITKSPQGITNLPVSRVGQWQSILDQPLERVAFIKKSPSDGIEFDKEKHSLTVNSDYGNWIFASRVSGKDPLRIRGTIQMENWLGVAGFAWSIAEDPNAFPEKRQRCLMVGFERYSLKTPLYLCFRRLDVGDWTYELRKVKEGTSLDRIEIPIPESRSVALEVQLESDQLEVWMDGRSVWKPKLDLRAISELAKQEGSLGLTGKGKATKFQNVSVKFLNSN